MSIADAIINHHLDELSIYDRGLLLTALHTACFNHKKQFRDSGEPYYTHLISVDDALLRLPLPGTVPITLRLGALLHDILENCSATHLAMLVDEFGPFGPRLAAIVLALTRTEEDKTLYFLRILEAVKLKKEGEKYEKHKLWEAIFIKLADRLHNLTTIDALKRKRIVRKLKETLGPLRECVEACRPHIPEAYLPAFDELRDSVFALAEEKALVYRVPPRAF